LSSDRARSESGEAGREVNHACQSKGPCSEGERSQASEGFESRQLLRPHVISQREATIQSLEKRVKDLEKQLVSRLARKVCHLIHPDER
jgi:hypothetical protein